ncbi:MAG: mandelate racemase/muconate lactonizing enzyme family protein [Saprospiraceae bacterium]|nr:mandelate racemase/muconate lactonizing enzyme family protein [Saprospiraceae bacterium]NJL75573.1 mandelate racemase/muconate lactonizing enzyme family protein [Saprospiraceae bacterium]
MLSRKKFLRTLAASVPAVGMLPHLHSQNTTSTTPYSNTVKITDVKCYVMRKALFVKVETDAGISGWGEGDHDYSEVVEAVVNEICKPLVVGQDPFQQEYIWNRMYFLGIEAGNSGLLPGAIAGVDNALWDLKGKLLGKPVHQILGGNNVEKIKVYGSFPRGEGNNRRTPDQMAAVAAGFVELGYTTVKPRMQIREHNLDPLNDDTFEIVKAVRKAVGDDIQLFVDFNNGYSSARATMMVNKLYEHFNISAVEEPVSHQNYEELRKVVDAVQIPVLAGEHEYNKWQFRDLIVTGGADILNTDVIKCGGISECKKVAILAECFNRKVMVHNARPTLATAASLQLVATLNNAERVQEYAGKREELGLSHLFDNYFEVKEGHVYLPTLPGLGLVVNEKEMEKSKLN